MLCHLLDVGGYVTTFTVFIAWVHGYYFYSKSWNITFQEAANTIGFGYGWFICVVGGFLIILASLIIKRLGIPDEESDGESSPEPDKQVTDNKPQLKLDKFCPYCGDTNPNDYNFCRSCKKELP